MAAVSRSQLDTMPDKNKKPYPVMDAVIRDEVVIISKGFQFKAIELSKVVKLLTDPHSVTLYDRHAHSLQKVLNHYNNGFLLKDLVEVFKILNICVDRIGEIEIYAEPLLSLLKICAKPFLKQRSSDEKSFEQIGIASIAQLGYLMRCKDPVIQIQICHTILSIYQNTESTTPNLQLYPVSHSFNQMVVEKSDVSETLVKSLLLISGDPDVQLEVLRTLRKLSKYSELTCAQILAAQGAKRICSQLNDQDENGELLFISTEILWNLLENGAREELKRQLNDLKCISELRDAFLQVLSTGYSHYDRQIRNDLLVLTTLVANTANNAPLLETGFVKQLTTLATFQEVKTHSTLTKHLRLKTNHEDLEMKKLLINIMVILSENNIILPILSESKLLLALLSYVKPNGNTTAPQEWSPAQFEEIQLHALSALCTLSPVLLKDYISCQGTTRLLLLLEWCVSSDDYAGHGNSFHGTGGRGNKRAQMRYCIRLLRSVVSTHDEQIVQDMVDQGSINQLLGILASATKSEASDDSIDIEMQSDMLIILSAICESDIHRKELFGSENLGINIVTHYLKMNPENFTSGIGHHRLMLATVDAVWCCVVGCYLTEDAFLANEGVFLLLDLLENAPKAMRNVILGCLIDLCENSKTSPHIRIWRGKGNQSACHLLCDTWRQEEQELRVKRTDRGALADASKPLMGEFQDQLMIEPMPSGQPSNSIVDVVENMRAKIYALFCKIGYTELPGMNTQDYVTLTIIEQYFNLKMGEVWNEMMIELSKENIRPVSPDQEALETIGRAIVEDARSIALIQHDLLQAQNDQDLIEEKEYYSELRENNRQQEKAIEDWSAFIARTSNYSLLKTQKDKQSQSVDASRTNGYKLKPGTVIHKPENGSINTTVYSSRNILIESTPLHLTGGKLADYQGFKPIQPIAE